MNWSIPSHTEADPLGCPDPLPVDTYPLCEQLRRLAPEVDQLGHSSPPGWPARSLQACRQAGLFGWFQHSPQTDSPPWPTRWQTELFVRLGRSCMTTGFILTQRTAAVRRLEAGHRSATAASWLATLASGEAMATVAISHLTTSRQFSQQPVLRATPLASGRYRLDGYSPWVTGARHSDLLVVGATCPDGNQLLAAVATNAAGLTCGAGLPLLALTASCTDRVDFDAVTLEPEAILAGPAPNVLSLGSGGQTGGLQTSALAIGSAAAAIDLIAEQSHQRESLTPIVDQLARRWQMLHRRLIQLAQEERDPAGGSKAVDRPGAPPGSSACLTPTDLRGEANQLAIQAAQAALTASKGAGYCPPHPAQRLCRESLFFLVWSCPQPLQEAHLCQLAGLSD
jgi:alkylation response protein AidB-like acyl-CoA dehydrogenase